VNLHSPPAEKIALFRALFRGREDVYPLRFESRKTGRAGYSPACGNEWARGICEKPRLKCSACTCQNWLPVSDDAIHKHLSGDHVMGVYPMLLDESCFFLAVDFDGTAWIDDAGAFLETCRQLEIPAALERSRSGEGGHIWFFFDEVLPASLARKLGSTLLTVTMESRPGLGLASYDRLFPNQDTLPKGGIWQSHCSSPAKTRPRPWEYSILRPRFRSSFRPMGLPGRHPAIDAAGCRGPCIGSGEARANGWRSFSA
jgi:hypothetical protein